jgi:MFS family permease
LFGRDGPGNEAAQLKQSSGKPHPESKASACDRAVSRSTRRLIPFLLLMYVVAFLDRTNIGFAKQALQTSAGISAGMYAFGAGVCFLSYALFEIPSNLILHRVGARVWMTRIMLTWGLVSMATMLVRGSASFYLLRLLLGAAEAGFFPGVILYLTYWFPNRVRGRILGLFYFGAPLAFIFGGPLSGLILEMRPVGGLQNWQWMFLVEGFLSVVVGLLTYRFLDDRPSSAAWLAPDERQALTDTLAREEAERSTHGPARVLPLLRDLRVLHFVLVYALLQMSIYGVVFYLPSQVSALLHQPAGFQVGMVSAIPWICALAAAWWIPRAADARSNHRQLAVLTLFIAGCASLAFPSAGPRAGLIALSIAASGYIAVQPLFWTFPTNYLAGRAAAGGLAMINALGAVGGFLAPNLKVWADDHYASQSAGLYVLAALTFVNVGMIALFRVRDPIRRQGNRI